MGRPRKPTALKVLQGNPGKRALPKNEPTSPRGAKCPGWVGLPARALWNEWAPIFEAMGTLTVADTLAFANWMVIEARIADGERGAGLPAGTEQMKLAQSYAVQFGGTPAARSRVTVATDKPESKLERFLGKA